MSVAGQDFSIDAGEHKDVEFEVEDVEDLVGCDIWWVFANSSTDRSDPIAKKTLTAGEITVSDNQFTVALEPSDTVDLAPGSPTRNSRQYHHEGWIEDADDEVRRVAVGTMTVEATVQPDQA